MDKIWQQPLEMKQRLYYMDALRAFLMSYGVLLHAAPFLKNNMSAFIGFSSNTFRMETFFIISGLFTAFVISRSYTVKTFGKRLYMTMVPFVLFLVLFNPFSLIVISNMANYDVSMKDLIFNVSPEDLITPVNISWHLHLWFLPVLALYTCLYPIISIIGKHKIFAHTLSILLDPYNKKSFSFFIVAVAIALSSVALRGVYYLTLEPYAAGGPLNHILAMTFQYLPFFFLGCSLFFYKPLFDLFHNFFWKQFILSAIILGVIKIYATEIEAYTGNILYEIIIRAAKAFCSVYSANILIKIFQKMLAKKNDVVMFLSDSAYTVYLFHLYIQIGIFYLFYDSLNSQPLLYILSVIINYSLCLAIHKYFVSKYKITRNLINGKLSHGS